MTLADFAIKKGDNQPVLSDTLTYNTTPVTPADLTGATVRFVMRSITAAAPAVNAVAAITLAAQGKVSYTFTAADTAVAGAYMGEWHVTFAGGATQTWPTDGYLELIVEEDLVTPGGARLVGLGELKDHLRIPATDRTHDSRLVAMIDAAAPVVEGITGPVLQRIYQNETYDGGWWFISLKHRPVVEVHSVVEYRGPIRYELTQVPTPDLGTIYSYMFEAPGRIVRRTVGGGMTPFPSGADQVFVTYTAGLRVTPPNIREGTLELIRVNYQPTEQGRHAAFGGAQDQGEGLGGPPVNFFVPERVREMLSPNKRHPSVA